MSLNPTATSKNRRLAAARSKSAKHAPTIEESVAKRRNVPPECNNATIGCVNVG